MKRENLIAGTKLLVILFFVFKTQYLRAGNAFNDSSFSITYKSKDLIKEGKFIKSKKFTIYINGELLKKGNTYHVDSIFKICIYKKKYNLYCFDQCKWNSTIDIEKVKHTIKVKSITKRIIYKYRHWKHPSFLIRVNGYPTISEVLK